MLEYFIYGLFNGDTIFYVGVTTNIKQRFQAHKVKYGSHIEIKELDKYFGSEDTALALELFWIKKYRDLGIELKNVHGLSEKRELKGYKIRDDVYFDAMKRAEIEGVNLASLIERWVTLYADGYDIISEVTAPE